MAPVQKRKHGRCSSSQSYVHREGNMRLMVGWASRTRELGTRGLLLSALLCSSCAPRCGADTGATGAATPAESPAILPSGSARAPQPTDSSDMDAPKKTRSTKGSSEGCPDGMVRVEGGTLSTRRKAPAAIKTICVDRIEVTVQSYAECVAKGVCQEPGSGKACNWGVPGREQHPINCVDLAGAEKYCKQKGARLPDFNEWEWAAEGRDAATSYPWGNSPPEENACWSGTTKRTSTCPVGSFPSGDSPQGISDLSGNVSEWTTTAFLDMPGTVLLPGGSWWDKDPDALKAIAADHDVPGQKYHSIGFRCVK
ncbi:formylglycine-generating enzyme family protein [Polyangium jinanense]